MLNDPAALKKFQDAQGALAARCRASWSPSSAIPSQSNANFLARPEPARGHREPHHGRAPSLQRGGAGYNTQIRSSPAASSPPSADSREGLLEAATGSEARHKSSSSRVPRRSPGAPDPTGDRARPPRRLGAGRRLRRSAIPPHPTAASANSRGRWRRPIVTGSRRASSSASATPESGGGRDLPLAQGESLGTIRSGSPRSGKSARKASTTASSS